MLRNKRHLRFPFVAEKVPKRRDRCEVKKVKKCQPSDYGKAIFKYHERDQKPKRELNQGEHSQGPS